MLKKGYLHTISRKAGLSGMACWLVVLILLYSNLEYGFWRIEGRIIAGDVVSYYQYLPAVFVHHDITMEFAHRNPEEYRDHFWAHPSENGKYVGRMTIGMSVLYSPFFLSAHALARPLGYEADGFSPPYKFALILSCLFYVFTGLWFLRKALLHYFSERSTAITILILGLATNLYFYSVIEPPMSHAYSFSLIACLIYAIMRWYGMPSGIRAAPVGFLAGLILLIRPVNLVFIPLVVLWRVGSWSALKERISFLFKKWVHLLIIAGIAFLVLVPQFLYWHLTTGQWIYYAYGQERFFFNNPHIFQGMFSYRNGWLVYTPVMIFSIIGWLMTWKQHRRLYFPMAMVWLVFICISFSWWCWWYAAGFGLRAMIDSYALLAFPLTAFTGWVLQKRRIIRIIYLVIIGAYLSLNVFQTHQYYTGAIHWGSMTRAAYWESFLRKKPSGDFKGLLKHPDYELAKKGISGFSHFEKPQGIPVERMDTTGRAAFIREAENVIRNDTAWYNLVLKKSAGKKMSVEEVIQEEALWVWKQKQEKRIRSEDIDDK